MSLNLNCAERNWSRKWEFCRWGVKDGHLDGARSDDVAVLWKPFKEIDEFLTDGMSGSRSPNAPGGWKKCSTGFSSLYWTTSEVARPFHLVWFDHLQGCARWLTSSLSLLPPSVPLSFWTKSCVRCIIYISQTQELVSLESSRYASASKVTLRVKRLTDDLQFSFFLWDAPMWNRLVLSLTVINCNIFF